MRVGESCIGISYFEQETSSGLYYPKDKKFKVRVIIRVRDSFGKYYYTKTTIPKVILSGAQEICENFGKTIEQYNLHKRA